MNASIPPLAIGEERIPPPESEQIERMLEIFREIQEARDRRSQPVRRNLHPKQHGCVRAELAVERDLPPEFRYGLFCEPRIYSAVVRFSSAKMRDDRMPDVHGVSVKLVGVEGGKLLELDQPANTHDFVCIDHPVFFAGTVARLLPLIEDYRRLMTGGLGEKSRTLAKALVSFDPRFRLLRKMLLKRPDDVLRTRYWTTTPVKIGAGAMKLSLQPEIEGHHPSSFGTADRLRLALADHLGKDDARFALCAQLQADPALMPIEDATVLWPEGLSPFRKIATLWIPSQVFDTAAQKLFGEGLSFTPWHALAEHRPLGGINRARKRIYQAMADHRRQLNGMVPREPDVDEVNRLWPIRD